MATPLNPFKKFISPFITGAKLGATTGNPALGFAAGLAGVARSAFKRPPAPSGVGLGAIGGAQPPRMTAPRPAAAPISPVAPAQNVGAQTQVAPSIGVGTGQVTEPVAVAPTVPTVPAVASATTPPLQTSDGATINPNTGGTTVTQQAETPVVPRISYEQTPYRQALSDVEKQTQLSPEEVAIQESLNQLQQSFREGTFEEGQRPIPLEFITGRQKAIEQRALGLQEPLINRAALLQAQRQGALEAAKFRVEQERPSAPVSVSPGASLVDPATGKTIFTAPVAQKSGEQFTLSPGQARFDENGDLVAFVDKENEIKDKIVNIDGVDYVQTPNGEFVRPNVPVKPEEKAAVQALSSRLELIDEILGSDVLDSMVGPRALARIGGPFSLGERQAFAGVVAQLTDLETLNNLIQIKAQGGTFGALSEKELQVLQNSATKLNAWAIKEDGVPTGKFAVSEKAFREEVNKLRDSTKRLLDQSSELIVGGGDLDTALDDLLGFNSAGGPTVRQGNRPQRNLNPGNVKRGGVADRFATTDAQGRPVTDEQGHLVFSTPEAGFNALRADLKAKISGGSRHISGTNPTIEQLGRVYAEDPNWPRSVAKMLGVSPATRTQSVPFERLVKAVAQQEGFYA